MPRHSFFRRFASLVLAVLVLFASVGLTVQRFTCRMSGKSRVDVSMLSKLPARGCNAELLPSSKPVVKDNCCDTSSHLHKLTASTHELAAKVLIPIPALAAWLPDAIWPTAPAAVALEASAPRWFAADSSPPPRGGRALLAFICTLEV